MEQFSAFVEKHLAPYANKLGRNKYIQAIQNTFLTLIPFMTIGSFALIFISPVLDYTTLEPGFARDFFHGWADLAAFLTPALGPLNMVTTGALALWASIGLGFFLSRHYKMTSYLPVAISTASFLLMTSFDKDGAWTTAYFDTHGLFAAILISFATVELYRFLSEREVGKITIAGQGVPPALLDSFANLAPAAIVLTVVSAVAGVLLNVVGVPFPDLLNVAMEPVVGMLDNVWGVILLAIIVMLFWWFGIHDSVITGPLDIILYRNLGDNMVAYAAGVSALSLPYVLTEPFWWTFMAIGGSGATFCLAIMAFRSKSKQIRTVGKLSIIPAFFNINEPLIFGLPLMYNPIMMFPFIFAMAFNGAATYLAMAMGFVSRAFAYPSWNLFAPIGAFLETMDIRAVILVVALIVIDGLIYYPFFKMYEKQKLEEERLEEAQAKVEEA